MSKLEEVYYAAKEAEDALAEVSRRLSSYNGSNREQVADLIAANTEIRKRFVQIKASIKAHLDRCTVEAVKGSDRYEIIESLLRGKIMDVNLLSHKELSEAHKLLMYAIKPHPAKEA